MSCITIGELKTTGAYELQNITKLHIETGVNIHAKATINAVISINEYKNIITADTSEPVTIWGGNKIIFCGIVENLICKLEDQYSILTISLISNSILLDMKKKKRSFQDISLSISNIMEIISETSENGQISFNANDMGIQMPLIQYMETDWEFILRLASRLGSVVYPDIKLNFPGLYVGMPESENIELSMKDYSFGLSEDYYSNRSNNALNNKHDYIYYEVKSYEDYNLGNTVSFLNKKLKICYKEANLVKSEVIYTYKLGSDNLVNMAKFDNKMFAGMTILGKVLSSANETVRLHLDIDEQQDEGKAYDYEWTPETGNTMYCMPKLGTTVSLYFKDEREESALAISCIRENGGTCEQMSNVNDRYLTTENNKQLHLKPESMGLASEETGMKIVLNDSSGINVECSKEVFIIGKKKIQFNGKKISISTPSELKIIQG
jgi:hypothetical protein